MNSNQKIVIYQVFTRLFGADGRECTPHGSSRQNGCGKFSDFSSKALAEIKALGATHIWYTGVIEHATQTDYRRYNIRPDHPAVVKGCAGSPYAIKDYYDIDPDLATCVPERMKEFESLVSRTHHSGLKVIIDFVPNHVSRQYHSDCQPVGTLQLGEGDDSHYAFSPRNNFYYIPGQSFNPLFDLTTDATEPYEEFPAKATGNNHFSPSPNQNDWYETIKLNYGVDYPHGGMCHFSPVPDTWHKMLNILLFWAAKGIDGFRCDMAEMVPVEFWEWTIPQVKTLYPDIIFIAEVYNPAEYRNYLYRGGFDYLYDKVGLYDTLRDVVCQRRSATDISRCWQSLSGIENRMLNFLENHDEQRIASDFFAGDPRLALPALIVSATMNVNPMMIYFGQELGERGMDSEGFSGCDGRTTIFDYWTISSISRWRNGGQFNSKLLTPAEQQLRSTYQRILNLCNIEPAIARGKFFDLTYANIGGWRFNEHRQYAYFRREGHDLLLIVVNFDRTTADVAINLPSHAFDYLSIPQIEDIEALDLLSGLTEHISLLPYKATNVNLPPSGGKILKVKI